MRVTRGGTRLEEGGGKLREMQTQQSPSIARRHVGWARGQRIGCSGCTA